MKKIVKESIALFDSPEKFDNYLEIVSLKDNIVKEMYRSINTDVLDYFSKNEGIDNWSLNNWNIWDYKWYLQEFGAESVGVWQWGNGIGLFVSEKLQTEEVQSVINQVKYSKLKNIYVNNSSYVTKTFLCREEGLFVFKGFKDSSHDGEKLAWHIYNNSKSYLNQVIEKVDRVRKDPEIVQLIKELNIELGY